MKEHLVPTLDMMHYAVLKIPEFGVINQNTIGMDRHYHQYRGKVSQLAVYNIAKSEDHLSVIEDILKGESMFKYDQNAH